MRERISDSFEDIRGLRGSGFTSSGLNCYQSQWNVFCNMDKISVHRYPEDNRGAEQQTRHWCQLESVPFQEALDQGQVRSHVSSSAHMITHSCAVIQAESGAAGWQ
jgi:hypothetical protein